MRRLLTMLVPLALVVASCGDDDGDGEAGATTTAVDEPTDTADATPDGSDDDEDDPDDGTDAEATPETTVPADAPAQDAPAQDAPEGSVDETEGLEDPGVLIADLTGPAEVPGPGDDGATGRFEAELVEGRLCIDMRAEGLDSDVGAAHVHDGAAGATGPPVVDIGRPTTSEGTTDAWADVCVEVADDLIERMATQPEQFYVNVHTASFPEGAVRGQLALASIFDRTLP